ncbi:MAG: hypothetical protein CMF56_12875 [Leifsonia sp.]|nr:hypothetical protein [Leifsonia sp.]HAS32839.1 hypothetical protein [Microbacterium sp.]HBR89477.1 hypothetical protein [Microbacterium sp.]|tara:strand:- start:595 stop:855 length:261 start_codon:yes stop_codon:yes gene_type:complete
MIDRAEASEVVYRVSVAAFAYYAEKPETEAGYTVDEDVDWSIEPMRELDRERREELRARVRDAIVDAATIDRQEFIRYVKGLATDG